MCHKVAVHHSEHIDEVLVIDIYVRANQPSQLGHQTIGLQCLANHGGIAENSLHLRRTHVHACQSRFEQAVPKEGRLALAAFDFMTDRLPDLVAESCRGAPGPHILLCLSQELAIDSSTIPVLKNTIYTQKQLTCMHATKNLPCELQKPCRRYKTC